MSIYLYQPIWIHIDFHLPSFHISPGGTLIQANSHNHQCTFRPFIFIQGLHFTSIHPINSKLTISLNPYESICVFTFHPLTFLQGTSIQAKSYNHPYHSIQSESISTHLNPSESVFPPSALSHSSRGLKLQRTRLLAGAAVLSNSL